MYKNDVRVYSSPPVFRQGYSQHALCSLTPGMRVLGEPRAGLAGTNDFQRVADKVALKKYAESVLRQKYGEGGLF